MLNCAIEITEQILYYCGRRKPTAFIMIIGKKEDGEDLSEAKAILYIHVIGV